MTDKKTEAIVDILANTLAEVKPETLSGRETRRDALLTEMDAKPVV